MASAAKKLSVVRSTQTEGKRRSHKSSTARMQAKTLAKAFRQGMPWDDGEVERLMRGIEKDETTYDIALSLGRSLYGTSGARAHVAFAMRHAAVLVPELRGQLQGDKRR